VATEVILPRLGQGMETGTIVRWLKSEGEAVEKGEPLFELDTDKVTQEVEAEASGVLLKIAIAEGEVAVGKTVAFIGSEGETVPEQAPEADAAEEPPSDNLSQALPEATATSEPPPEQPVATNGRVKASPLARRLAREKGLDLQAISGTGPEGRIVAEDVERAEVGAPITASDKLSQGHFASGDGERVPLTNIRKTIARRLTAAWQIPVFQLQASADMTRANALVAKLRERDPDVRVTVTDVLTKVAAQALMRHREVNAEFTEDAILLHPRANVAIAVAAPQGLVVPVIRSAERLSLAEIAAARADVVGRARDNKLTTADMEDGTFTISNLGMFGIEQFVAVINPPQAAILAVGATIDTPVARNGAVEIRPIMSMTLTVDHRAVDGAEGADFLRTVKQFVEDPALAL
jgi:pyruvate dehydrogenase E2 component (dihydrolipoamide acetyltransferase)